eukprot:673608-Pleurochrysis_carterae.AAC.1
MPSAPSAASSAASPVAAGVPRRSRPAPPGWTRPPGSRFAQTGSGRTRRRIPSACPRPPPPAPASPTKRSTEASRRRAAEGRTGRRSPRPQRRPSASPP